MSYKTYIQKLMKNKDFAIFILTHGRPDNVITYATLKKSGYTGKTYIIIDNEDKTAEKYKQIFGEKVIVFDKKAISETFDEADNFKDRRAIVYARNASFEIAKKLGIRYFMQLDDDYIAFHFRVDDELRYNPTRITSNFDKVMDILIDYYKSIPAKSIAMSQGGDYIGGSEGSLARNMRLRRKCMNSFICDTERPFQFVGRINEDVNTYTKIASTGALFLTVPNISLTQKSTQTNAGGMTDIYLDNGTYIKSFYTIIFNPSSVTIALMGDKHRRLHHRIDWKCTVPMILNEKYKINA